MQKRIDYKKNLQVPRNIRNVARSKKPLVNFEPEDKVKTPPEVEEMRKYLGIAPDEWFAQGAAGATSVVKTDTDKGPAQVYVSDLNKKPSEASMD